MEESKGHFGDAFWAIHTKETLLPAAHVKWHFNRSEKYTSKPLYSYQIGENKIKVESTNDVDEQEPLNLSGGRQDITVARTMVHSIKS